VGEQGSVQSRRRYLAGQGTLRRPTADALAVPNEEQRVLVGVDLTNHINFSIFLGDSTVGSAGMVVMGSVASHAFLLALFVI
jgi:hypothetical protein